VESCKLNALRIFKISFNITRSQNAGQNCIGIERLIVHQDQYDDLYQIIADGVNKLRLGSVLTPTPEGYVTPVDCGAMISGNRFRSIEGLVREAENEGAQVQGGKRWKHVYHEDGTYFSATVVGPVDSGMEIAQTERM
jgi:acyl-CoA reductase-like NAD-dependent aldehyde dehydrogenase